MGPELKPASKGLEESYEPTDMVMHHDSVFVSLCPDVANSGNLAHKWDVEGDHTACSEPPADLKGD